MPAANLHGASVYGASTEKVLANSRLLLCDTALLTSKILDRMCWLQRLSQDIFDPEILERCSTMKKQLTRKQLGPAQIAFEDHALLYFPT